MRKISGWDLGKRLILLLPNDGKDISEYTNRKGMKAILSSGGLRMWDVEGSKVYLVDEQSDQELRPGDILSVAENGIYNTVYKASKEEIDVFVTNQCNSNCIMCPLSESVRRKKNGQKMEWLDDYIDILPDMISYVNVTGGEPTLRPSEFLHLMSHLTEKFDHSDYQLLTNGRSCADKSFLKEVLTVSPRGMRFAIPVHASNPDIHDAITRVPGSFKQTDRGIKNLLSEQQKVEIRVVVSKYNIDYLEETARYIAEHYKGVFCVNFMGMEMMGNAAVNRDALWIDYDEVFKKSKPAIDLLVKHGIDVQLYNLPLCAVDRGYWHIAAKSITDYKIRFMDECDECEVKEICGGFFYSTKQVMKPQVYPIRKKNET